MSKSFLWRIQRPVKPTSAVHILAVLPRARSHTNKTLSRRGPFVRVRSCALRRAKPGKPHHVPHELLRIGRKLRLLFFFPVVVVVVVVVARTPTTITAVPRRSSWRRP
jgi:hypothetical protein